MNRCQNCDWTGPDSDLLWAEIKDLGERVAPGEPMPSGECPVCGCLCQPVEETEDYAVAIEINVTAPSTERAIELALDDLRDPTLEWTDFTVTHDGTTTEVHLDTTEGA